MNNIPNNFGTIVFDGIKYTYIKALAKNGDRCLATKDPLKYCNGVYSYSSKDPGSGVEYVIINEEKQ
jgi:hypothetical protein